MAKIFYIDDDELIRNLLARTFRSKHYDSEGFSNCEEALSRLEALASNQRPDLIFTDTQLVDAGGVMKGYELCREVKTGYPETKVIGTSGAIGEERREFIGQYRKAGADAFIEKPFELKDVLSKIKELLGE